MLANCNHKQECVFRNSRGQCLILTDALDAKCKFAKSRQDVRKMLYDYPPSDKEERKYWERLIEKCDRRK